MDNYTTKRDFKVGDTVLARQYENGDIIDDVGLESVKVKSYSSEIGDTGYNNNTKDYFKDQEGKEYLYYGPIK